MKIMVAMYTNVCITSLSLSQVKKPPPLDCNSFLMCDRKRFNTIYEPSPKKHDKYIKTLKTPHKHCS